MAKQKTIYVVYGSEDGILGVASNKKAAHRIASSYDVVKDHCTYDDFLNRMKSLNNHEYGSLWIEKDGVYGEITIHKEPMKTK
jgi:hypothetical protein